MTPLRVALRQLTGRRCRSVKTYRGGAWLRCSYPREHTGMHGHPYGFAVRWWE